MTCPEFNELMAYLDGELSPERSSLLEEHLSTCAACTRVLESQRRLEEVWREDFSYPSEELFRQCENRIGNRLRKRSRWRTILPVAAAVAAVFLGVKLVLLDGPSIDTPAPVIQQTMDQHDRSSSSEDGDLMEVRDSEDMDESPLSESEISWAESASGEDIPRYFSDSPTDDVSGEPVSDDSPQVAYVHGGIESPDMEFQVDDIGDLNMQDGLIGGASGGEVMQSLDLDGSSSGIHTMASSTIEPEQTPEEEEEGSPLSASGSSVGCGGGAVSAGFGGAAYGDELISVTEVDLGAAGIESSEALGYDSSLTVDVTLSDEFTSANRSVWEMTEEESEEECATVSGTSPEGIAEDSVKTETLVRLTFDQDGTPDSLTAILLDSLLAEWSMYIPFAFRDTVLIVPAHEVVTTITSSASAAPAQ